MQCQRSPKFTRLDQLPESAPGVRVCPGAAYGAVGCQGGELYIEVGGGDLHDVALGVVADTEAEFGVSAPRPWRLILGEYPQQIVWQGRSEIYVGRLSVGDPSRFLWQFAHEGFHHTCSPPATFHWTHEMLATMWAARLVARTDPSRANQFVSYELSIANRCAVTAMLNIAGLPYPDGLYGRALMVGAAIEARVGWDRLKTLATCFDANGKPDWESWVAMSPPDVATLLRDIVS